MSIALAGQMASIYTLSYALLSPVVAAAAANCPRKRLLLTGRAIFILEKVLMAIGPHIEIVLASRPVAGNAPCPLQLPDWRGRTHRLTKRLKVIACSATLLSYLGILDKTSLMPTGAIVLA